ncbi:Protein RUBCNL-like [Channa argus]|uniref:Protein RUBCNL-like n=1 Tax=Channa argus TaxID=215402 RepID=A0A6G1PVN4_CHAAH|nr:Protein RUBCNL-like [Channa argus]
MRGSCRGMSSSVGTTRVVKWCVDSAESLTPVNTAQPASAPPSDFPQNNHQAAGSGSIPLLLLSAPETAREEAAFSRQCQRPKSVTRTCPRAFVCSRQSQLKPRSSSALHSADSHSDGGAGDKIKGERKLNDGSQEDPSLLHPDNERFHLPRSSPVISRRQRPLSWHGGGTDTTSTSSSDSPSPASGSLSQHQHSCPAVGSMEDLGSKQSSPLLQDKKQRSVSGSANLNSFLMSLFHIPFSGQQGQAEEHQGRSPRSCSGPHSQGSSNTSEERRCSGVPEFSAGIFKTSCELEKENAHFIVVDMVLEVLEGVKWTLTSQQQTSTDDRTCTRRDTTSADCPLQSTQEDNKAGCSGEDVESSRNNTHQCTQDTGEEEEPGKNEIKHQPKSFSVLSNDSGFEDYGGDTMLTQDSLINAEFLAQQLVMEFRRSWLPSRGPRRGRQSLRSSLQELPGTGTVAVSGGSLTEEIRLRTRMRGSLSWAPPRFQIIFTVQPTHRRSEVVARQHFLCAGCGTKVEPRYIKKLRYCEYLGRYFCDCCHSGSDAVIPGRVLSCWDFSRQPVSDFSKQLLDSVWYQPLFDLTCVGKTLYSRVKELDKLRELQEQLQGIRKLLKACRLSGSVMTEFEQLPAHLTEQPHVFSMDDLFRVKKGQLVVQARAVVNVAIDHVENCKLCQARGFICEFCRERDIIFPFQTDVCKRCPACRTCFHKNCFAGKKCPKCARIQSRRKPPDASVKCDE